MDEEFEQKVEHLLKISNQLSSEITNSRKLKSHYMLLCKKYFIENKMLPPAKISKESVMCKYCANIWKEGMYKVTISHKKPGKKIKKLLKKPKNNLSKIEKKLFIKINGTSSNQMILTCLLCKKATSLPCLKNFTPQNVESTIKSKNKNKKDTEINSSLNLTRENISENDCNETPIHSRVAKNENLESLVDRRTMLINKLKKKKEKNKLLEAQKIRNKSTPKKQFVKCNKLKQMLENSATPKMSKNSLKAFLGSL